MILALLSLLVTNARADEAMLGAPFKNFHQVTEQIFRGGRPGDQGVAWLAQHQVATDIDLENKPDMIASERDAAANAGMRFISLPMDSSQTPDDATVTTALSDLANPALYPVFIHCHHGEDRTGLIVGLYRVRMQGWSPQQAYQEMMDDGFMNIAPLLQYFEKATGFSP